METNEIQMRFLLAFKNIPWPLFENIAMQRFTATAKEKAGDRNGRLPVPVLVAKAKNYSISVSNSDDVTLK
jgi:hypothetical protein